MRLGEFAVMLAITMLGFTLILAWAPELREIIESLYLFYVDLRYLRHILHWFGPQFIGD